MMLLLFCIQRMFLMIQDYVLFGQWVLGNGKQL